MLCECAHNVHTSRQQETPWGEEASVNVLPGAQAGRNEGNTGMCKCLQVCMHEGECKFL